MGATISDVARRAGVSMKTVSRVINNEPNVAVPTREKVQAAARALSYTPNMAARGLASSRAFLLAMLYDNPNSAYIMALQSGVMKACRDASFHLLTEPMGQSRDDPAAQLQKLLDQFRLGGVILTPPLSDNVDIIRLLNQRAVRYVPVAPSAHHGDVLTVRIDDVRAARQMTEHLISLGHKKIGFVKGLASHSSAAMRFQGYREAMRAADLKIVPDWVWDGDYNFRSAQKAALKHLGSAARPTAIFASNDDMAAGVMAAAGQLGLSIPVDLSVCGFDDTRLAEIIWPPLTTVRQPVSDMGERAARILITPVKKLNTLPKVKFTHEIISRNSCGSPKPKE